MIGSSPECRRQCNVAQVESFTDAFLPPNKNIAFHFVLTIYMRLRNLHPVSPSDITRGSITVPRGLPLSFRKSEIQDLSISGGQDSPRRGQGTGGDPTLPGSILLTRVQRPD